MKENSEEKNIKLPNGKQMTVEEYLEKIIDPNIPFAMYKLKTTDGKKKEDITSKEFIERFIYSEGKVKYIGNVSDIKALLEDKVEAIYINDKYVEDNFKKIAKQIVGMKVGDVSFVLEGYCGKDLSGIDMSRLSQDNLRRLTFDSNTKLPENENFIPDFVKKQIEEGKIKNFSDFIKEKIEQGKSFFNTESIHKEGINGTGTTIVMIDSCFNSLVKEFAGRVKNYLVFEEINSEVICREYRKEDGDGHHGKTTASLSVGEECGVAPNAEMYLFGIAEGTDWAKAKEAMLKYIKQETENGNMKMPDIISMSADKETSEESQKILDQFEKKGCAFLDSSIFWKNFSFGRMDDSGEVLLDGLMEEICEIGYDNNIEKVANIINNIRNARSVVLPCTERTSYSEERRKRSSI